MSSPGLQLPTTALDTELWHTQLEVSKLIMDAALSGTNVITATSGTATVASADDTNDAGKAIRQQTSGALTADLTVDLPAKSRLWILTNGNSGAFTTTFKVGASTLVVSQGRTVAAYSDGTTLTPIGDFTIAAGSILTTMLADLAVTTAKLAAGAVTTAKIADANVTQVKLDPAAITAIVNTALAAGPITAGYVSPPQAFGSCTLTHGLGSMPTIIRMEFVCISADLNYSVNDRVPSNSGLWANSTQIGAAISGSPYAIADKSSGNVVNLNKPSWNIVLTAFK